MIPVLFCLAILFVMIMGFCVQRGATCLVAAVDEWFVRGTAKRATALGETALWSVGLLLVASAAGVAMTMPKVYETTWIVVPGGVLLGLGAWLNGACVFGAIARLGNGELRMLGTIAGYPIGTFLIVALFDMRAPTVAAPAFASDRLLYLASGALIMLLIRFGLVWRSNGYAGPRQALILLQKPHAATVVIGVTYVVAYALLGGNWTYMDIFNELPKGNLSGIEWRAVLFVALAAGSLIGGITAGRLSFEAIKPLPFLKCVAGGAMMAAGSLMIPGYNDGLILFGAPLLLPYALIALMTMIASIAVAIWLSSRRVAAMT